MRIAQIYSHLNGLEYLHYHKPHIMQEVEHVINSVNAEECRTKESKEARKSSGGMLYSPIDMNKQFVHYFGNYGWREERVTNWLSEDIATLRETVFLRPDDQRSTIISRGLEPIMTYNQTDFVKDRVAVEIQFGKYSFVAHDLFVKHMSFFSNGVIDVGIEVSGYAKVIELLFP